MNTTEIINAIFATRDPVALDTILRETKAHRDHVITHSLRVGDRATFTGPYGERFTGTVKSVNRKSVTLVDVSGNRYSHGVRVAPALLSPAD